MPAVYIVHRFADNMQRCHTDCSMHFAVIRFVRVIDIWVAPIRLVLVPFRQPVFPLSEQEFLRFPAEFLSMLRHFVCILSLFLRQVFRLVPRCFECRYKPRLL